MLDVPLSTEKTVWPSLQLVFLGCLLDGENHLIALQEEKIIEAIQQLRTCLTLKKVTVKQIQCLTGLLNFLCQAIHSGRAFTRRMYYKLVGKTMCI